MLAYFLDSRLINRSGRVGNQSVLRPEQLDLPVDDIVQVHSEKVTQNQNEYSVTAHNLCKTYKGKTEPFTALNGLTLGAKKGEVFGLLGPNGSGKSTAFNILSMGFNRSTGDVKLLGRDIEEGQIGTHLGMCPQDNMIWEYFTVRNHFHLVCRIKGLSTEQEVAQTT